MRSKTVVRKYESLPGVENWSMLVHLMRAGGYYKTNRALAVAAGSDLSTVTSWINGKHTPKGLSAYRLLKIARSQFTPEQRMLAGISQHEPEWFIYTRRQQELQRGEVA